MSPPPMSTQLTVHIPACINIEYRRTCANVRVVSHVSRTCTAIYIYLPVIEYQYVIGHHVRIFSAFDIWPAK